MIELWLTGGHENQLCNGESGSEPQTEVYVETESSFGIATKFKGAVGSLLISLKYPFWR